MRLYQVVEKWSELMDLIVNGEVEEEMVQDTLESIEEVIEEKVSNGVYVIRNMESDVVAIDEEIKRLTERKARIQKGTERLKDYLLANMVVSGTKEVKNPLFTVKVAKNPPKVNVLNEADVPKQYMKETVKVTVAVNKTEISKLLKAGEVIPGVELIQTEKLTIK